MKDASLEFILEISLKKESNTEVFSYGFFTVTFFKLLKHFLRDIFAKHCLTLSQPCNLTCLIKYIELAFNSKGDL